MAASAASSVVLRAVADAKKGSLLISAQQTCLNNENLVMSWSSVNDSVGQRWSENLCSSKIAFIWGFCQNLMPFQTAAKAKQLIKKHAMHVAKFWLSWQTRKLFSLYQCSSRPTHCWNSPVAQIYHVLGTAPFSFRTLRYSNTNSIQCIENYLETNIGCLHQLSRKPTTKLFPCQI